MTHVIIVYNSVIIVTGFADGGEASEAQASPEQHMALGSLLVCLPPTLLHMSPAPKGWKIA